MRDLEGTSLLLVLEMLDLLFLGVPWRFLGGRTSSECATFTSIVS